MISVRGVCSFSLQAGLPPLHAVPVGKAKALLLDRQCNVPFFREIHKVCTVRTSAPRFAFNDLLLKMAMFQTIRREAGSTIATRELFLHFADRTP